MAVGPSETPAFNFKKAFLWTEIFRTFQVALDPRKLLVAAAGILVMSIGWYLLSRAFITTKPDLKDDTRYGTIAVRAVVGDKKPDGREYTEADYKLEADRLYLRDMAEWKTLHNLAGENGRLRTMPWYEYRGPNPFSMLTTIVGGSSVDIKTEFNEFLVGTVPVLIEPLMKILLPVFKLLDPNASTLTRLYLLLALIWSVVTWAFFGGIITRIAAVQFAGKDRITLMQAVRFVATRYTNYVLSPLVPLGLIAIIVVVMALYGLLALIPGIGDIVLYGIGMPLVVLGGIVMAILLVGLIGYPLMYCTLSTEGSDTFDALSRSYNYVFQAPWSYLWYATVSIVYGAVVTLFVIFMGSLMVYMGKWAISQAPLSEYTNRKPDYLFIYAPESFGWKELLLKGSPVEQNVVTVRDEGSKRLYAVYQDSNPAVATEYRKNLWLVEKIGAGMTTFWLVLVFMLVIGFSYSYFWSASTMIYLLMRKKVDDTELDEIYIEESLPETPTMSPTLPSKPMTPGATTSHLTTSPTASLPVIPAPAVPPAPALPTTVPVVEKPSEPTPDNDKPNL